jgi:hypothetical protein
VLLVQLECDVLEVSSASLPHVRRNVLQNCCDAVTDLLNLLLGKLAQSGALLYLRQFAFCHVAALTINLDGTSHL